MYKLAWGGQVIVVEDGGKYNLAFKDVAGLLEELFRHLELSRMSLDFGQGTGD